MITTYEMPGEGVHPEGITEDPDGVTFYVSSAKQGTIFRGRVGTPELEVWQPSGVDGRNHALGMAVDARGRLLVCGYTTGDIFAYDTASGALVAKHRVPATETLLNDVCVHEGYAYVTDSARPVIWRLATGDALGEPVEWLDLGEAELTPYLNGIVAHPDGRSLLVAAQGTEVLWHIDIATKQASKLDLRVGADGMVFAGDLLYVCDNVELPDGTVEFYVSAIKLDPQPAIVHRTAFPAEQTPTTVAYLQNQLLVVNSQFLAGRQGTAKAPFTVTAIAL